ncbi:MAG: PD-(D/E)XK nuclease family protein, partial [bacterium]
QKIQGRLQMWFEMEWNNIQQSIHKPAMFEIGFGNKHDRIPAVDLGKGLILKGKIDRIELSEDLSSFVIADYKTGKNIPGNGDINKGKEQQMPLYALAAQEFLKTEYGLEECKPHHAVYYSLHDCSSKVVIDPEQKRSKPLPLESLLALSQGYVQSIHAGDYHVKPTKDSDCNHCSYMSMCRISAIPPMRGEVSSDDEG